MKSIQAKNKQRSKTQEREIARYFHGDRVPMSGAGNIKGDVLIPYDEYRTIYIECKLTEKDTYRVPKGLLDKIEKEAKNGRCIFGMLIVKFMNRGSFVVIRAIDIRQWFNYTYDTVTKELEQLDTLRYKKYNSAVVIRERVMYIFTLEQFKEIYDRTIERLTNGNEI